ncbi:ferrous iron transport protein B [Boudabousia tangfeifanii]|uniref:Ferrous iron transport protein B n=1 Tax=Boudabousia tangfeifanii TaxID=1912795 RepID=A0A1D9MMR2_9ACTO|nr:ferrous iron transport protein B [Boudabousia tangfeifanii]
MALVGNPNVGKSTLFNTLTGAHQKVVNAPGTTVEVMEGRWAALGARILDLPGTYSLIAASPDEQVVTDTLRSRGEKDLLAEGEGIDLAVVLLDASALTRSLYLLGQVARTGLPVVGVVTLADVAEAEGDPVDEKALAQVLGIPVVKVDPRRRESAAKVQEIVEFALENPPYLVDVAPPECCGRRVGPNNCPPLPEDTEVTAATEAAASQSQDLPTPTVRRSGVEETAEDALGQVETEPKEGSFAMDPDAVALFDWVEQVQQRAGAMRRVDGKPSRSDKIDAVLLHPLAGIPVFFFLMWLLFKIAGDWVGPLQDWFDGIFSSTEEGDWSLANGVSWVLETMGLGDSWVTRILVDGVCTGLGVVASFVPLMAVIFLAISILEDSGYMARAAFLGDRLMRLIGLDGRVILPFIMGFGCNLPALAGLKTLPSAKQRFVSVLLIPYTSCAARLTIYLMIARIFFPGNVSTVVFSMYVLSIVMVVVGALILRPFFNQEGAKAPLMLVLPAYQAPRVVVLVKTTLVNVWQFVKGAGSIIVVMTLVVWLMGAIPMVSGYKFADEIPMSDSLYGRTAQVLEPVFKPAGFGEWHMTGALMTGFVAKETVVSSIVTSYALDPDTDGGDAEDGGEDLGKLPELVKDSFNKSAPEAPGVAAFAFLVFVLTYTPCLATVAEQARLIGGKATTLAVLAQLIAAWVLAVLVYQVGSLLV